MVEVKIIDDSDYDNDLNKFVEEQCKAYIEDLESKLNVVLHFNLQRLLNKNHYLKKP